MGLCASSDHDTLCCCVPSLIPAAKQAAKHIVLFADFPWAARCNTWLLIKLTPKGVVVSFLVLFADSLCRLVLFCQPHAKTPCPFAKRPALSLCCCALQASRPKLALWRSARERGIWMRDMAAAQVSTSAAEVAYLAAVLSDK